MKRELEAKPGAIEARTARAIALMVLLCVSGTAARAQKKSTQKQSGQTSHSGRLRSSTTTTVTPPSITAQPAGVTTLAGGTASFSVAAAGTAPLAYQWYENGMPIGGATSSNYTISATTTSYNGAQFTAAVSNSGGTATSNAALLTVNPATLLLNSSSKSLGFGSVNVSSSSSQSVTLTNTGIPRFQRYNFECQRRWGRIQRKRRTFRRHPFSRANGDVERDVCSGDSRQRDGRHYGDEQCLELPNGDRAIRHGRRARYAFCFLELGAQFVICDRLQRLLERNLGWPV